MLRYTVVIEGKEGEGNLSGFVPDLPGCVSTGNSVAELKRNLAEAIQLHLHGLLEDSGSIPKPEIPPTRDAVLNADPELAQVGTDTWFVDVVEVPDDPQRWEQDVVTVHDQPPRPAQRA